ncbi:MAG: DUF1573 domain-containing protein [Sedimentisphaerales bacterium]|nr:DUF1573 domain-containing protein [Sedimentisphaerales bacterium]
MNRIITAIGGVACCAVVIGMCWWHWDTQKDNVRRQARGGLLCSEPECELGVLTAKSGFRRSHTFRVVNVADCPIEIRKVTPTCGCVTVGDLPDSVGIGEVVGVEVDVDWSGRIGCQTESIFVVTSVGADDPVVLTLRGYISVPVRCVPNPVTMRNAGATEIASEIVTLYAPKDSHPIEVLGVECSLPNFVVRETRPPGHVPCEGYEQTLAAYEVSATPGIPETTHQSGEIRFRTSSPELPVVSVPIRISWTSNAAVEPKALFFSRGTAAVTKAIRVFPLLDKEAGIEARIVGPTGPFSVKDGIVVESSATGCCEGIVTVQFDPSEASAGISKADVVITCGKSEYRVALMAIGGY